jgi:hypothetical protein
MAAQLRLKQQEEKLALRSIYSLVMGLGAFFAYFNSIYRWVSPPEYHRIKGAWLKPLMPVLDPYLPQLVLALGAGFLAYAVYCFWRCMTLSKTGG